MTNTVIFTNGNTYNDGGTPPNNMGNGGYRENFIPCLTDTVVEVGLAVEAKNDAETAKDGAEIAKNTASAYMITAEEHKNAAAASAANALALYIFQFLVVTLQLILHKAEFQTRYPLNSK